MSSRGMWFMVDVRVMLLSIEKLDKLGWEPEFTSEESIAMTARDVLRDFF